MCKAHILRFSCGHGVLMGFETCNLGPCPVLKTTGSRLPQQPYRCYNCQHKAQRGSCARSMSTRTGSSASSTESFDSSSSSSSLRPTNLSVLNRSSTMPCHPLPGVAIQPSGCIKLSRPKSSGRQFSFSCNGSSHFALPHYSGLPNFLPHQDHPCPPCQLENLKVQADEDVTRAAKQEYPNLRAEMLVRDGRVWEDWQTKPSLEKYVDEKRTEEREMWLHVTRKWTQDLKKARVLVAEEDGLGLFA